MEEAIKTDSQHPTAIVSNLTTLTAAAAAPLNNNTPGTMDPDGQPLNDYEPDSKCEMTTLEKAYYEPPPPPPASATTELEQEQEQEPDNGACNLNQTSFDPQVIEDYVERGGCQQFIQNLNNSKDIGDAAATLDNTKDIIDSTIESFDREMRDQSKNALSNLTPQNPIQTSMLVEETNPQIPKTEEKPAEPEPPTQTDATVESSKLFDLVTESTTVALIAENVLNEPEENIVQQENPSQKEEPAAQEEKQDEQKHDVKRAVPQVQEESVEQEDTLQPQMPAINSEDTSSKLVDECAEREKLVEALISATPEPINEPKEITNDDSKKEKEDVEMKVQAEIQSDQNEQVTEPVVSQIVEQPQEPEELKEPVKEEEPAEPELPAEAEEPNKEDEAPVVPEEPVEPQEPEPPIKTGRSRRSSSKTEKAKTRASKRHQPQEVKIQEEISAPKDEPQPSTDLKSKDVADDLNVPVSPDDQPEEPQKQPVTRKRLHAEVELKTPDDKLKQKLSITTASDQPIEDSFRKFRCQDCGYSTDRLNNIVYHKKNSCQHLKQSWDNSVKNYISGLVKSPKSNKKRRLR